MFKKIKFGRKAQKDFVSLQAAVFSFIILVVICYVDIYVHFSKVCFREVWLNLLNVITSKINGYRDYE